MLSVGRTRGRPEDVAPSRVRTAVRQTGRGMCREAPEPRATRDRSDGLISAGDLAGLQSDRGGRRHADHLDGLHVGRARPRGYRARPRGDRDDPPGDPERLRCGPCGPNDSLGSPRTPRTLGASAATTRAANRNLATLLMTFVSRRMLIRLDFYGPQKA